MTKSVLIHDNDPDEAARWTKKLNDSATFEGFHAQVLSENSLSALQERYDKYIRGSRWDEGDLDLDRASVLFVDYRLGGIASGEQLAYLVRCFSNCQMIVGVNRFGTNPFDLTLQEHFKSFCDLNIGDEQLTSPGLWKSDWDSFRPWYWPLVPQNLRRIGLRMKEAISKLDAKVVDTVGFTGEISYFPKSSLGLLGGDPGTSRLRDLVSKSIYGLQPRDRRYFKPEQTDDAFVARIACACMSKWMEQYALQGQDILVDAPHLVTRFPSLLSGERALSESWNKTAGFGPLRDLGIKHKLIDEQRLKKDYWLSRPAWFWRKVSRNTMIADVHEPWKREQTDFVFCEDMSAFRRKSAATLFHSQVDSPYVRRYVRHPLFRGVDYEPRMNLVLDNDSSGVKD